MQNLLESKILKAIEDGKNKFPLIESALSQFTPGQIRKCIWKLAYYGRIAIGPNYELSINGIEGETNLSEKFTFKELSNRVKEFAHKNGISPDDVKIRLDAGANNVTTILEVL